MSEFESTSRGEARRNGAVGPSPGRPPASSQRSDWSARAGDATADVREDQRKAPRCYSCGRPLDDPATGVTATVAQVHTSILGVHVRERRYRFHATCLAARRRRDRRRAVRFTTVLSAVTVAIAVMEWRLNGPPVVALLVGGLGAYFVYLTATEVRAPTTDTTEHHSLPPRPLA